MIKYPTARRLQGRGGLIRVKLPDGRDYAFITIYARVEEPGDSEDEVNNALWEWAESELRELPTRCTPVIFTDANGHTGKGHDTTSSSHGIGPEGAEKENKNGKLLREFCERTDMVAINTWWPRGGGATYFTAREIDGRLRKYSSRIDYVLIPKGEMNRIRDCRVLKREGLQLQNTHRALCYLIDHVPVRVLHEGLAVGELMTTRTVRRRLDREGLASDAQNGGQRRTQLAQRMSDVICQPWVEQHLYTGRADVYERIAQHMWEAEGDIYGIQPSDHKYGQQTTDAMKHKRQTRADLLDSVTIIRYHERTLRGIFTVWVRWTTMHKS